MKLLKIEQVAESLGLSRWTIQRMLHEKALPSVLLRSGKRKRVLRVREDALEKFIEDRETR